MPLMSDLPNDVDAELCRLQEHYDTFEVNNRGANGYLFFAVNRITQQDVAIKFYCSEPGREHDEPRQLATINSPNVLPILDARTVSEEWAFFITPRCSEGDLDDLIESNPSIHRGIDISLGICRGVSAIHANGMLHRDLKPANIVIDRGVPRIADFGSVKKLAVGCMETTATGHSVLYRPPESFASNQYNLKGDVYQIGLVSYQLMGGVLHYDGVLYMNRTERRQYAELESDCDRSIFIDSVIRRCAQTGKLVDCSSLPPWVSLSARRLLRAMTNPDPEMRAGTIGDVVAGLTQIRSDGADWRWAGENIEAPTQNGLIQLRPVADGCFAPYRRGTCGFRRVPRVSNGPFREIVKELRL